MIALLFVLAAQAPATPAPPPETAADRLYVFRFAAEDVDAKVVGVVERAVVEEADAAGFDAVSHEEIGLMLDVEAAKQLAGCSAADSCVAELAGSLGVARVVSGKLTKLGDTTILALTLTDAKSARVVARQTIEGDVAQLRQQTPGAVRRLLGVETSDAPPSTAATAGPPVMMITGGVVAGLGAAAIVVGGIPYALAQGALSEALTQADAQNAAAAGKAHDDYESARAQWNSWGIVAASVGAVALVGGVVVLAVGAVE